MDVVRVFGEQFFAEVVSGRLSGHIVSVIAELRDPKTDTIHCDCEVPAAYYPGSASDSGQVVRLPRWRLVYWE